MTEAEAQGALTEIALELVAITDRLQRIHDELPESPNREAMWAHELPFDVATEIYGTIECLAGRRDPAGGRVAGVGGAGDRRGAAGAVGEEPGDLGAVSGRL